MTWIYTRRTSFVLNLSRLFTVQLSMFSVVFSNSDMLSHLQVFVNNFFIFLFQFFRTDVLSFCDSFDILSNLFRFVKNFFHFLFRSDSVLCDSLIILSNRQSFVNNFFKKNFEQHLLQIRAEKEGFEPSRRLTRPIPLAGAPLRPLEYFSKVHYLTIWCCSTRSWRIYDNTKDSSFCQSLFFFFLLNIP